MRPLRSRWRWTATIALLFYVAAYLVLRYAYMPHKAELNAPLDTPLSPRLQSLYAQGFYPLRWLTAQLDPPADKAQVGTLKARTAEDLQLEYLDTLSSIGFVCSGTPCSALAQLPLGQEVEIHLGWALSDDDRFINRLIGVRPCLPKDAACDAIRARQSKEQQEQRARYAVMDAAHAACQAKMDQDMAAIGFAVPNGLSREGAIVRESEAAVFSRPEIRRCLQELDDRFSAAVHDSCQRHACGDNIGGGCWHVAPNFLSSRAVAVCRAQLIH